MDIRCYLGAVAISPAGPVDWLNVRCASRVEYEVVKGQLSALSPPFVTQLLAINTHDQAQGAAACKMQQTFGPGRVAG
jgi:hypothetical protein